MRTAFLTQLLPALLLALAACSSAEPVTRIDSRPGTDLARYHTYGFLDEVARNDSAIQNPSTGAYVFELKRAVTRELEARGLRRAAQPDLWVNLGLMQQQRTQTREAYYPTDGAPYYIGQRNYHWQANPIPTGTYQEGTVTIDLVDAARKELVWQATTTSIISSRPARATQQIDASVAQAFGRFSVQPAGK